MLRTLKIKNYALIDELQIDFKQGFTVITGETGAGKSILLGALSLLTGQRADTSVIKNKQEKCIVEANFNIKPYNLHKFFKTNELDYFDETIIRREIAPNSRSRAFINDTPVNLQTLKQLSILLVDIHSQHDSLQLNETVFQLNLVDTYAQHTNLLENYAKEFHLFKKLSKNLQELQAKAKKQKADLDYFKFQYEQIDSAKLINTEQNELEEEQKTLNHAEEIKSGLTKISIIISDDENSINNQIKETINITQNLSSFFPKSIDISKRLESVYLELQDLSSETEILNNDIEHEPERLEFVDERLNTIYNLQQKFQVSTIHELLGLQEKFNNQIKEITSFDEQINKDKKILNQQEQKLNKLANKISVNRKKIIPKVEKTIISLLKQLGMQKAQFVVSIKKLDTYTEKGIDNIVFLFSANNKIEAKQISKVASGGELSRLILSLKYLISQTRILPTIIFDEIDTGVSGDIADKVAIIMKKMSDRLQVINISHLPQVVAKADTHLLVYKTEHKNTTSTNIKQLDNEQRINEVAKMLSGKNITEAAIKNAKELLNN